MENLVRRVSSSKVLPMQFIAAHAYMVVSDRGGKSSEFLTLQPNAAHSYMADLVRGNFLKSTSYAVHCSPLIHGSFRQGKKFLKNPPIAANCSSLLHGNFSQGFE